MRIWRPIWPNTGEAWAEKICAELALQLGLPVPQADFCKNHKGIIGSLTRSFTYLRTSDNQRFRRKSKIFHEFQNRELILGNHIIYKHLGKKYKKETPSRKEKNYTVKNIIQALRDYTDFPLWEDLLKYFIFDCYTGNLDRHHENWGLLKYKVTATKSDFLILAPTYDHGTALVPGDSESNKAAILQTGRMNAFYKRARSVIHKEEGKRITFLELLRDCIAVEKRYSKNTSTCKKIIENIGNQSESSVDKVLQKIPMEIMSDVHRQFVLEYLKCSRELIIQEWTNAQ